MCTCIHPTCNSKHDVYYTTLSTHSLQECRHLHSLMTCPPKQDLIQGATQDSKTCRIEYVSTTQSLMNSCALILHVGHDAACSDMSENSYWQVVEQYSHVWIPSAWDGSCEPWCQLWSGLVSGPCRIGRSGCPKGCLSFRTLQCCMACPVLSPACNLNPS